MVALSEASQEAVWLTKLLKDLDILATAKHFVDNESSLKILESEKSKFKIQTYSRQIFYARDFRLSNSKTYEYLSTDQMLADIFQLNLLFLEIS